MKEKKIHLLSAVLATGIMSFAGVLIETAMNVTFPTLIEQFGISTGMVQWVTTIYLLVISIMVPFSNYLLKNFSIRRLFVVANLFFIAGLVTDLWSPTFTILLVGRLLQGISTGIALPLMFHIILNFTPMHKRGTMMGVGTLTTSIAPAIGPTYGGIMTANLSWHAIFLFLLPVLAISLVIGLFAIPEMPVKKTGALDLISLIGIALLFSGLLLFLNQLGNWSSLISLVIGIVGLLIFYRQATRGKNPLVRITVLKNKAFVLFLCGFLVCQFLLLGISFVLPNFIQIVLGKDAFIAGLVMMPGAAVGAILAPISGRILDTFGSKKPILLGLSFAMVGWIALTLLLRSPLLLGFVAGHVFYMIGIGFSYSNLMTTGMNLLSEADYGDGNTLFNTLQQFSGAVATAIVATIINLAQQAQTDFIAATITGSQLSLLVLLGLLLAVFIACLIHFRKKPVLG
ncbi:MFS transporter [Enterococcus dongliensis]|uniref:MFS transporter n=1 Tax=Enterococcus dongliensis TaxID=2559925 RepID=A0AAP5KQI5_9ENTE|nr:MFS transporter [Enterococcus dongliensis]MDT2596746.1 MFS transporter [Enterococcus dongliensis]MDT2604587.1 MFS transporter [Enterococcus dongliensis]MDT2635125.1 MFS transporter [Enterococcus dongliensis]MDT2636564.1 MFS transporter [Enterococcus dongliensis]MDT2640742.1 MFS transporter [Enterococcus dongliensis]